MSASGDKIYTRAEVASRNTKSDLLVVIDNEVYDLTQFQDDHPGGHEVFLQAAGQDASEDFHDVGHSLDAKELMRKYRVGAVVPTERVQQQQQRAWAEPTVSSPAAVSDSPTAWRLPVALGVLATLLYYLLF